jgi:hypothetical protein
MLARLAAVKIWGSLRLVIMSVLEGGVGCESCGRSLRSSESEGAWRRFVHVAVGDSVGDEVGEGMIVVADDGEEVGDIGGVWRKVVVMAAMFCSEDATESVLCDKVREGACCRVDSSCFID